MIKQILIISLSLFALNGCTSDDSESSPTSSSELRKLISANDKINVVDDNGLSIAYERNMTQNFVSFIDESTVLHISLPSISEDIPATATINIFSKADSGNIFKWVNNKYSDGLYENAPSPVEYKISDEFIIVESPVFMEFAIKYGKEYSVYDVEYQIVGHELQDIYKIDGFSYKTKVYVRRN